MRERIKTSLISLVCAAAVSAAGFAAPSVRSVGGTGSYTSAADAANTTAARSGSLRATGSYVRPTATTTSALKNATTAPAATATVSGGATSTGTTTVGRVATSPRLSVGKYIGSPTSISTSNPSSELTQRLDKLELDVDKLGDEKQDILSGSDYITINADNEVILEVDKIREDLDLRAGKDGREVEIGTNDNALLWRYTDDDDWEVLITWERLKQIFELSGLADLVTTMNQTVGDLADKIDTKLNAFQGTDKAGNALVVDSSGNISATGQFAPADSVYTKDQVYTKDEIYNKEQVYNKDEVYDKTEINSQFAGVNLELNSKVDVYQGRDNSGKTLIIDESGNVIVSDKAMPTVDALGDLAYKNTISNGDVDDGTLERAKLAESITDTLAWIDEWRNSMPDSTNGDRYVFAIDENGDAGWFLVAE